MLCSRNCSEPYFKFTKTQMNKLEGKKSSSIDSEAMKYKNIKYVAAISTHSFLPLLSFS